MTTSVSLPNRIPDLYGESQMAEVRRHRRTLHQLPELAYREFQTAAYIEHYLSTLGLEVCRPTTTSVLGSLRTGRAGPTVVVRADMDALAIAEETGLPFAATNGSMHACGHDGHMAVVLTVAGILSNNCAELCGEIRFLFQHAEEPLPSGAPEIIAAGVLDGADMIIGHHVWTPFPLGVVDVCEGPIMASCDYFDVTVFGTGGHGAMPHESVDAICVAAQIVSNIQHIVSREISALNSAVISITGIDGGTEYNVLPTSVALRGTVRAFDERTREYIFTRLETLVSSIAAAHGGSAYLRKIAGSPPVENHPGLAAIGRQALSALNLNHPSPELRKSTAGEDFAWYQKEVPGLFFLVGGTPQGAASIPHHHPKFDFDDAAMDIAVRMFLYLTLSLSTGDQPCPASAHGYPPTVARRG